MAVINQDNTGGVHYHTYNLTQQDLELETKSESVSVRFYPKEFAILKAHAERYGTGKLGNHVRHLVIKYLKSEKSLKQLHQILDDINP